MLHYLIRKCMGNLQSFNGFLYFFLVVVVCWRFLWYLPPALRFTPHCWLCANNLARSSTSSKESALGWETWETLNGVSFLGEGRVICILKKPRQVGNMRRSVNFSGFCMVWKPAASIGICSEINTLSCFSKRNMLLTIGVWSGPPVRKSYSHMNESSTSMWMLALESWARFR